MRLSAKFNLSEKQFLVLLFIFSLLLKVAYAWVFANKFHPDKWDFGPYETMAVNFMKGNGLIYDNAISPTLAYRSYNEDELAYPLVCGIVYILTKHNLQAMLFLQIIYASLIPIFIYLIARRLFDLKVARLAGFLASLVPGMIIYSAGKVHSMSFYALVFCVAIWSVFKFMEDPGKKNLLLMGFFFGLGILSRNNFVIFIPFILLYLYLMKKIKLSGIIKVGLIIILTLLPLVIRNYRIYQRIAVFKNPVMLAALWPSVYDQEGRDRLNPLVEEVFSGYNKELTDREYAALLNKRVVSYFKEHPADFFIFALKRFYYFWWFSPHTGREYPGFYLRLYKPYHCLFLFFTILGFLVLIARCFRDGLQENHWLIIPIFIFSTSIPHYLYYTEGRHRAAIEPLLCLFTAYGLIYLYRKLKNA